MNENTEYASKGVANTGLGLSIGALLTANALRANPKQVVGKYISFLQMLGIVSDDESMVDVDLLETSLMQTFNEVPVFTIFGIDIDSAGARMLINHLRNA